MDYKAYEEIIAIARTGSISKAAEYLFVSRTSLNRKLIAIEEELGTKIFKRVSGKLVLTYAGRLFLESAVSIVQEEKDLRCEIEDITGGFSGRIFVGIPVSWANMFLSPVMKEFNSLYPNVSVELSLCHSSLISKQISEGMIDIGIMSDTEARSDFKYEKVFECEYLLMLPKSHPYAVEQQATGSDGSIQDLRRFQHDLWALGAPGTKGRMIFDELFNIKSGMPRVLVENCIYTNQIQLVNEGLCNAINIDTWIKRYDNVVGYSFVPKSYLTLVAAHRGDYSYNKPEQAFVEILRNVAENA